MISVIIPLYNKEAYIKECLESVLNQTNQDFELIVVDDSSKDKSVAIVKSIRDSRIRLISRENGGPSAARNTGIIEAKGEWIVFLDADDQLLPFALEYFTIMQKRNPGHRYYVANYFIKTDKTIRLSSNRKKEGLVKTPFYYEFMDWLSDRPGSAMFSAKLIKNHLFNEALRRFEDAENQYDILKTEKPFQSWIPVMITNRDASEAAGYRKNIREDFLGHMVFENKSFWERMQLLKLSLDAKRGYQKEAEQLYSKWYARKDLLLLLKLLRIYGRMINSYYRVFNPILKKKLNKQMLICLNDYKDLL